MTDTPPDRVEVQAKEPSKADTDRPPPRPPVPLCSTGRPHKFVPARRGQGTVCGNCGRPGPA